MMGLHPHLHLVTSQSPPSVPSHRELGRHYPVNGGGDTSPQRLTISEELVMSADPPHVAAIVSDLPSALGEGGGHRLTLYGRH